MILNIFSTSAQHNRSSSTARRETGWFGSKVRRVKYAV